MIKLFYTTIPLCELNLDNIEIEGRCNLDDLFVLYITDSINFLFILHSDDKIFWLKNLI